MRETDQKSIQRRDLLKGTLTQGEPDGFLHISSAVVTVRAENAHRVADRIAAMSQTEVHAIEGTKIILVLEGRSVGEVGSRLAEISVMEDVFSANLVFEQILALDENGAVA